MIKNYNIFIRKKYNTVSYKTVSIYTFYYTFILIPFLLLHFKTRLLCRPVSGLLFIYKDSPHTCCDRSFRNDRSGCDSGFSPCFAFFFFIWDWFGSRMDFLFFSLPLFLRVAIEREDLTNRIKDVWSGDRDLNGFSCLIRFLVGDVR